jgi:FkbM family methyltransferase
MPLMDVIELDSVNRLVHARHGWFLANRFDHYLGAALIRYGECCELEHQFLQSLIGSGDYVVEAGSNIGVHTIGLAKAVGPSGAVVAIEPQPEIFRVLCANIALNGLRNVTPFAVGCGERAETMLVPVHDYRASSAHNSGSVSLAREGAGMPVSVVPLDDLLEHIPRVRLLKIDVEGMEREALLGARRLIERCRPLLYVENDRVETSAALMQTLSDLGYRMAWHTPSLFNPHNHFAVEENDYPNVASFNLFCEPREAELAERPGLRQVVSNDEHPFRR